MDKRFEKHLSQIALFILLLWIIHLMNVATGLWFTRFGIVPRTLVGLRGILFAPLLHGNWAHLAANSLPLAVMLSLFAISRRKSFWPITAVIWFFAGMLTWLIGRPHSVQIGASGLIYGLAAYLVTASFAHRDLRSALLAILVVFLYGGIVWGLLPSQPGVSWEGHLAGAFSGFLVATKVHTTKG